MTKNNTPVPTSEIVATAPDQVELDAVSTKELHDRLSQAIGMTETAILTVARVWRELTRRGEDMSRHRFALARFMQPLATGRLLPALVVQMSGQPRALERLAELPVTDQRRLLDGEPLEIYSGDGEIRRAPLSALRLAEISLAVRDGQILSAAEQRLAFERSADARRSRSKSRGRPYVVKITADKKVKIGHAEVDAERVIAALRSAGLL